MSIFDFELCFRVKKNGKTHVKDVEVDDSVSLSEGRAVLALLERYFESVVLRRAGGNS